MWRDHAKLKVAKEVRPGEEFEYFDLGDNWRHRCTVEPEKGDPVEEPTDYEFAQAFAAVFGCSAISL